MDPLRFTNAYLGRLAALTGAGLPPPPSSPPEPAEAPTPTDRADRSILASRLVSGLEAAGGMAALAAAGSVGGPPALVAAMQAAEAVVDNRQEQAMGENVFRFYSSRGVVADDPRSQALLEEVAAPLLEGTKPPGGHWSLHLMEGEEFNATASFGGFLYANRGVLTADPSLRAFALGHEAAHGEMRHDLKRQGMSTLIKLLQNDEGGREMATALQEPFMAMQRGFEREADRRGLELAIRVGADPAAIAAEVESWEEGDGVHPPAAERAAALREQAQRPGGGEAPGDDPVG